jgi:hypothetical protein
MIARKSRKDKEVKEVLQRKPLGYRRIDEP